MPKRHHQPGNQRRDGGEGQRVADAICLSDLLENWRSGGASNTSAALSVSKVSVSAHDQKLNGETL
jgi:hypothetical protein